MLSILPGYERGRERDSDRSFMKSFPHAALNQPTSHTTPYYNPFSSPTFLSSFPPNSSKSVPSSTASSATDTAMDLRPQASQHGMYDPRMFHDNGLIDMTSHISHRIPSIKQESHQQHQQQQQALHDYAYSHINTNPAHQGYTSLTAGMASNMGLRMDMNRARNLSEMSRPDMGQPDMGSPPQASLANIGNTANSPQASSQAAANLHNNTIGMNSSSDRSDHSGPSSPEDPNTASMLQSALTVNPINISPRMPPKKRPLSTVPEELKDNSYWDKRKKNNESAKRSREARRMKEEHVAVRVVYLEQENLQLRTEVSLLKSEIEKLRVMLYNS